MKPGDRRLEARTTIWPPKINTMILREVGYLGLRQADTRPLRKVDVDIIAPWQY
jgi:hypothetical protein